MAPRFTVPNPENLEPVWPGADSSPTKNSTLDPSWPPIDAQGKRRKPTRAEFEARSEASAGPLKPVVQLFNTLSSPDVKAGIITGPINGVSKLGNALGDLLQSKPIDVKDAWTISDDAARQLNPFRLFTGSEVTPSDQSGLEVGEGIGAEMAGYATGAAVLKNAQRIRQLQLAAQALQRTQAAKNAAVAIKASPKLRAGVNVSKNVGEALVSTTLAVPFLNQEDGNLANLGDAVGLELPGRVEEGENYLKSLAKSIGVEGVAAPLALLGAGSLIKPVRKGLASGGLGWIDELANAELEPYMYRPPADTSRQLPGAYQSSAPNDPASARAGLTREQGDELSDFAKAQPGDLPQWASTRSPWDIGGEIVPYDSAISRSLQEQTQLRQVTEQRQRLENMGLVERGEGGQLEFGLDAGVDPETKLQVRQLQVQRGQLLKQATESGTDVGQQLAEIDQQIGDLIQSGRAMDSMDARPPVQPELDMPDGRPELDTFLANLDELSDDELRRIHSAVWQENRAEQRIARQIDIQGRLEIAQQKVEQINARAEAGELTPKGAKRLLTKAQKDLDGLQGELSDLAAETVKPESLVGDQLQLLLPPEQMSFDMSPSLGDELVGIRALQQQRGRWQQMTETLQESLRSLRDQKAPAEEIKQAAADLALLRKQLADLEAEIKTERRALSPEAQLQLTNERWRTREEAASEFGYQTPDDYRNALNTWKRDELRRLAMPESSPEVAALVKARTGRRVWQAKKQDIIDALVELSERRGRYLPPAADVRIADQAELPLVTNSAGLTDAPLFDKPSDLGVQGMSRVVDADGVEQLVPTVAYQRRGLDQQTRELWKGQILQRAIQNGEVQPPFSPLPQRPRTTFVQGQLVDDLLADPAGQLPLQFATDQLPAYKAGGKSADAWIEEVRLRYEFKTLDDEAARAQRQAYLAEKGWDQLTWEQKKQLGILDEGFYSLKPYSDRFAKAFNPQPATSRLDTPDVEALRSRLDELTGEEKALQVDADAIKAAGGKGSKAKLANNAAQLKENQRKQAAINQRLAEAQSASSPAREPAVYVLGADGSAVPATEVAATPVDRSPWWKNWIRRKGAATGAAADQVSDSPTPTASKPDPQAATKRDVAEEAAVRRANAQEQRVAARKRAEIEKQLEKLRRQSQGGQC